MENLKSKITNAVAAEDFTRMECIKHFNVLHLGLRKIKAKKAGRLAEEIRDQEQLMQVYNCEKSQWCKDYFAANFPQFMDCIMGRILMGTIDRDSVKHSGYIPSEF